MVRVQGSDWLSEVRWLEYRVMSGGELVYNCLTSLKLINHNVLCEGSFVLERI